MKKYEALGPVVLRVALGIVFLVHSAYLKVFVFTVPGTVGFFESLGLPALSAYAVIAAEIVGGVLLIAGVRVREVAIVFAAISLGALWAHSGNGWLFTNQGGGWEFPAFLAIACVAQFMLGAGRFTSLRPERSG